MGMNTTTLGITVAAVALVAGVAIGLLPSLLEPNYGIILQASKADISDDKWLQIQAVLDKAPVTPHADSRRMLYRVREYKDGAPVGTVDNGTLPETQLLGEKQVPANFTGHAFQIGVGALERSQIIPKNGTNMPQAHFRQNILESKEMVKEVNKVLGP